MPWAKGPPTDRIEQNSSALAGLSRIAFVRVAGYKCSDETGTQARPNHCPRATQKSPNLGFHATT